MGRIYTVSYSGTLTAAGTDCDLLTIKPAANKPCILRGLLLGQTTEVGDTGEENIRVSILRLPATVTDGTGGAAAATPVPVDENDSAAGFSGRQLDTTVATTSGTAATIEEFGWNLRASPLERWWPDADFAPRAQNAAALVIRNQSTVADDVTIQLTAYVEEL